MALPKRRHSVTRGRKRRTGNALLKPGKTNCPRCDTVKEPHVVCPNCGFYVRKKKQVEVIPMEKT